MVLVRTGISVWFWTGSVSVCAVRGPEPELFCCFLILNWTGLSFEPVQDLSLWFWTG